MPTTQKRDVNILFLDIETAPNLAHVWGKWEQDVIGFVKEWYILSIAYRFSHESQVTTVALPDFRATYNKDSTDDRMICEVLRGLLHVSDIVVAHNGDQFDIPKINARLAYHRIPPPAPYKTVDTKKVAKRYFQFNSNSLNDLGQHLKLGNKMKHTGFALWQGCMNGDPRAWSLMRKYNAQDVVLLQKVYNTLKPWMNNHPNVSLMSGQVNGCPICGSKKLQKRGTSVAVSSLRQRYQCQDCGGWSHTKIPK